MGANRNLKYYNINFQFKFENLVITNYNFIFAKTLKRND